MTETRAKTSAWKWSIPTPSIDIGTIHVAVPPTRQPTRTCDVLVELRGGGLLTMCDSNHSLQSMVLDRGLRLRSRIEVIW